MKLDFNIAYTEDLIKTPSYLEIDFDLLEKKFILINNVIYFAYAGQNESEEDILKNFLSDKQLKEYDDYIHSEDYTNVFDCGDFYLISRILSEDRKSVV